MAYTKQTFVNNQTVLTAEMMDHIEAGIVENENKISQLSDEKVGVTPQTFTDEQKAQARENIGAQPIVTGNTGDFVVIGADGKVTTKTILVASEVTF